MTFDSLPTLVFLVTKIMALILLALYALFAGLMVRQEQLMDNVIDETFEPVLRILVLLHFVAAIALLIFAFVIL